MGVWLESEFGDGEDGVNFEIDQAIPLLLDFQPGAQLRQRDFVNVDVLAADTAACVNAAQFA